MDLLCERIMVEEILPRMHPISILCLAAASRHYNALVRDPDFAARSWQRAGIFFQRNSWPAARRPLFLTGDYYDDDWPEPATEPMFGDDLAFLPGPSAREKAYMRSVGSPEISAGSVVSIMHSAGGLLLCSRGITLPRHFYVCNPVTCQWVALPELPWLPHQWRSGLLTLDTDEDAAISSSPKRFQVALFNHPMHWQKPGGCIDLSLFSSDTGQWKVLQFQPPIHIDEEPYVWLPKLIQSGTAYWIMHKAKDKAIAYNSVNHSVHFIPLPRCIANATMNRIIGERHGGGLRYAHGNSSWFEVWDSQTTRDGNIMWALVHRIGVTELLEWNPEAADYLLQSPFIQPVGFHPTDDDVVFLGMPGAVAAYWMEYGTMSIQCRHDSFVAYEYPNGLFPFVHPAHPVAIPAIKKPSQ